MKDFEAEILEKARAKEIEKENKDRLRAFALALETADGQTVLAEILRLCPIDQEVFSNDPFNTAYLCGRRSIGLEITSLVNNTNRNIMIKKKED